VLALSAIPPENVNQASMAANQKENFPKAQTDPAFMRPVQPDEKLCCHCWVARPATTLGKLTQKALEKNYIKKHGVAKG